MFLGSFDERHRQMLASWVTYFSPSKPLPKGGGSAGPLHDETSGVGGERRDDPPAGAEHGLMGGRGVDPTISASSDGIALLDTAIAALTTIAGCLQHAHDLADWAGQAADARQRTRLAGEFQDTLAAVERIADSTTYQGHPILRGGLGCTYFQVNGVSGQIICVNLDTSVRCTAIGAVATVTSGPLDAFATTRRVKGRYITPPLTDLDFFTAPRHADLVVDGISVSLRKDWSGDPQGAASALEAELNAHRSGRYSVSYADSRFTITAHSGHAPVVSAASVRAIWFLGGTTVAAAESASLTVADGEFSVQVGRAPPVAIVGTFPTPDALAAAVNAAVRTSVARVDGCGALSISSERQLFVSGSVASALGFPTAGAMPEGSLASARLGDSDACHAAQQRINSAMGAVAALRRRFAETRWRFHAVLAAKVAQTPQHGVPILNPRSAAASVAMLNVGIRNLAQHAFAAQANVCGDEAGKLLKRDYARTKLAFCLLQCPAGEETCR